MATRTESPAPAPAPNHSFNGDTDASRELRRLSHELTALLIQHAPAEFTGGNPDPSMMRLAASGYRMLAESLEDDARALSK